MWKAQKSMKKYTKVTIRKPRLGEIFKNLKYVTRHLSLVKIYAPKATEAPKGRRP